MDSFESHKWSKLKQDILRQFDAEQVFQKYKPADVEHFAAKKQDKVCFNLTQWQRYSVKYKVIAGGLLSHMKNVLHKVKTTSKINQGNKSI
jgi:hypothetical protein